MQKLQEDSRRELISQSKNSDTYNPENQQKGKNRHQRRLKSHIANSVKEYNQIDMNKLFKEDILIVDVRVTGETNIYMVKISFEGFLNSLAGYMAKDMTEDDLDFRIILRALLDAFNHNDVKVHCTCPDFCLEEGTKIKLLNGEVVTIKELLAKYLAGEELWVYSTDINGDFKPGKVSDVWISGTSSDMIKITLDNHEEIITTPSHRYMLRDGSYKEARDLQINESLMPLYFKYNNGYEAVKSNSRNHTTYYSVYKQVAETLLQNEIAEAKMRSNENVIAIHHKDFNKNNNYPSNLYPMGREEHWMYHANHVRESGQLDKFLQAGYEYWTKDKSKQKQAKVCSKVISDWWANMIEEEYAAACLEIKARQNNPETKARQSASLKSVWVNYTEDEYNKRCEINRLSNIKSKEKRSKACRQAWDNKTKDERKQLSKTTSTVIKKSWEEHPEKYLTETFKAARKNAFNYERTPEIERQRKITKIGNLIQKIIDNGEIPSPETYEKYRTNGYPRYTIIFNTWDEVSNYFLLNHKVKSIEYLHYDTPIPVYDLTVDTYNNFYVNAGVILHNCYREAYWSTINGTNSGVPETRPSDETNPNDSKGFCKHINLVLNNNSWMMKVASVINNYIKYMRTHYAKLYADVIYPAIFDKEYEEPVQQDMFNKIEDKPEDELQSDEDTIDISNKWAKAKNQFRPGNQSGIRFTKNDLDEPLDNQEKIFNVDSIDDNTDEESE